MFHWMLALSLGTLLAALLAFGGFASVASGLAPALYFCLIAVFVGFLLWALVPERWTRLSGPR